MTLTICLNKGSGGYSVDVCLMNICCICKISVLLFVWLCVISAIIIFTLFAFIHVLFCQIIILSNKIVYIYYIHLSRLLNMYNYIFINLLQQKFIVLLFMIVIFYLWLILTLYKCKHILHMLTCTSHAFIYFCWILQCSCSFCFCFT